MSIQGRSTREIEKYRMDLVREQEVRWEGSDTIESGNYTLLYEEFNNNHQLGTRFFLHM
jgi:hypothetical protein